jgi:hypothetical protein
VSRVGMAVVNQDGFRTVPASGQSGANVYVSDEDCCECLSCQDVEFPCQIILTHIDENRCEDDIFDIYIKNPGTGERRFIAQIDLVSTPPGCCQPLSPSCPETRIDIPVALTAADLDEACRFTVEAELAGTNCCSTWTRLRITGSGVILLGQYFDQSGYSQTFDAKLVCNDLIEGPP